MHQNPSYGFPRVKNVIGVNLRNTVNPEKLLLIVITDRKVDIHHTIHLTYTYRHYKTIKKTTNRNGSGAIEPRQRPNRSPTNYLYTKPSNQSTHPQSIRRFSRPSTRVQPYMYTPCIRIHHMVSQSGECHRRQPQKHSKSRKVIVNSHNR